ncbi:v-type proton atpase subunit c4 [Quercus suber]|uniref:V-type proton ATPase proteolipid subunit n=1 Tax=Quercus suber TaxID=58331 RepID=A0AAW0KF11_QUESU
MSKPFPLGSPIPSISWLYEEDDEDEIFDKNDKCWHNSPSLYDHRRVTFHLTGQVGELNKKREDKNSFSYHLRSDREKKYLLHQGFSGDETAPFFGFLGAVVALVFSCMGVAHGTTKSRVRVTSMRVMRPKLVMKSIVPVVMAGVLGIYGLIIAVTFSVAVRGGGGLIVSVIGGGIWV